MASSKRLHIEALHSAVPIKVATPGKSRHISLTNTTLTQKSLQNRLRMVFYYKKSSEDETAWMVAAWARESISVSLADWPELAGRLAKNHGEGEHWEVKCNDAGVRMVQATVEMELDEFLRLEDRAEKEAALAHWVEIDRDLPNFSAPFYIQVTQFKGDGYTIGISFSLLLINPMFLIQFLKSWAQTHKQMVADSLLSEDSMYHFSYVQKTSSSKYVKSISLDSFSAPIAHTTALCKVPRMRDGGGMNTYINFTLPCLEEAAKSTGVNVVSKFSLFVNKSNYLEIESCDLEIHSSYQRARDEVKLAQWEELGVQDFTLTKGNKPVLVSYCVLLSSDEGLAVVMQSPDQEEDSAELFVIATIPKK